MTSNHSVQSKLRDMALRLKVRLIQFVVPAHLRRAIFHCTLAARLSKQGQEHHGDLAQTLVEDLDLICAYNAMLAPMSWNSSIWHQLPPIELNPQCSGKDLGVWCKTIMKNAPRSLLYGSPRFMYEDIIQTLRAVGRAREQQALA